MIDFKKALQVFKNYLKDYDLEDGNIMLKVKHTYEVVNKSGPDHNQVFEVVVHLGDITYGPEKGKSKKEAEQKVAKLALKNFK